MKKYYLKFKGDSINRENLLNYLSNEDPKELENLH